MVSSNFPWLERLLCYSFKPKLNLEPSPYTTAGWRDPVRVNDSSLPDLSGKKLNPTQVLFPTTGDQPSSQNSVRPLLRQGGLSGAVKLSRYIQTLARLNFQTDILLLTVLNILNNSTGTFDMRLSPHFREKLLCCRQNV